MVLHDFVSIAERLPADREEVEVLRDFGGLVSNPHHRACGCRFGVERTTFDANSRMFLCDFVSTGCVTHWRPAEKIADASGYPGLDNLIKE